MKTLVFIWLFSCFLLHAQTNLAWPVLHTSKGDLFQATVIRTNAAYLVISHSGGLTKVALTNLPEPLKMFFKYDPQKAAAVAAMEKKHAAAVKKAEADWAKYLDSLKGQVQQIRVTAIYDDYGLCQIEATNGAGRVYLVGLPLNIRNFYSGWARASAAVPNLTAHLAALKKALTVQENITTQTISDYFTSEQMARSIVDENNFRARISLTENSLEEAKATLDEYEVSKGVATRCYAYPTGLQDNNLPRWQAVN